MPATATFHALAGKCLDAYIELVLTTAQGGEIDPDDALRIALAAGRSAPQLAADVECCSRRFERNAAYRARNFKREIAEAMQAYRDARAEAEVLQAECEALQARSRAAHERVQHLLSIRNRLDQEQGDTINRYSREMVADAGAGVDKADWRNFALAK